MLDIDFQFVCEVALRSLYITVCGTFIASVISIPVAYIVAALDFKFKAIVIAIFQALMSIPPVVVGLVLYLAFSPTGFFGELGLLYGMNIMILAQVIIVFPIIFSICAQKFVTELEKFRPLIEAYPRRSFFVSQYILRESRIAVVFAIVAGFSRAFGEVGAVLMVGGNIAGLTQVLTTVIVQETSKGNLSQASILGFVLFVLALVVAGSGVWLQSRLRRGTR